jgi:nucleoside-diphosphate-sugar epimerase
MVKSVAIVGANGFLGKYLVAEFHQKGYSVVAVYNKSFTSEGLDQVSWISWTDFLKGDCSVDTIVYSASIIPYGTMNEKNDDMLNVNAIQVDTIHQFYPHVHFIYISSVSVYAYSQNPILENSPWRPQNAYAETKLAGELLSKKFERNAILRCSSIFGKGMKSNTFIPRCIDQAKKSGEIVLYGDGSRCQNYIHALDVASMCVLISNGAESGEHLAVAPESLDNLSIAMAIGECLSAQVQFRGEDVSPSFYYDASITYQKLNYTPEKNCLTTIKEMCHAE